MSVWRRVDLDSVLITILLGRSAVSVIYTISLPFLLLPGLEASLKSTLGESCPAVALVPVLDLPDSQILHLSCWFSL